VSATAIADYALLSDCHSAALVSRTGSVDWLCFPRFDSAATFARLLDDGAGHFALRPGGEFRSSRRYLDKAMVLETTFETRSGTAVLTDAMPVGRNERGHELGAERPGALLRRIACVRGSVDLEVEFAPRPEFGVVEPLLTATEGGVAGRGGAEVLLLSSPVALTIKDSTALGQFTLRSGEAVGFGLQRRSSSESAPRLWSQEEIAERIQDTAEAWRTWSDLHQGYEGPWRDLVHQSGRVLQALTYYPTGAMVAAATTSLPESAGGARNWDYRFTWVRDACLTMEALWIAACPDEAYKFFNFLAGAALTQVRRGVDLQIMFSASAASTISPSASFPAWPAGAAAGRYGSATAPGTSASSTSTESCSEPSSNSGTSSGYSIPPPASSSWRSPRRPQRGGRSGIREFGRSAASHATSFIPS
jgi:GH15 family glucan-1,4-alpha-glucosidase